MNEYKTTDLYIAAFLKARGYECEIVPQGKRCYFHFKTESKEALAELMRTSDKDIFNVNATALINEIKQLKAFVNNVA